jgi:hypothetical protein
VGALNLEADEIQNPALGALALWRFTAGYAKASRDESPTPIPLLFLVLAVLYHEETFAVLSSTQRPSGLRGFAGKFSDSQHREADILLQLHERCLRLRSLSLDSLRLALAGNLVALNAEAGVAIPLTITSPRAGLPHSAQDWLKQCEKLGAWCGVLSLHEIAIILRVDF